jgi:hypothetical protein
MLSSEAHWKLYSMILYSFWEGSPEVLHFGFLVRSLLRQFLKLAAPSSYASDAIPFPCQGSLFSSSLRALAVLTNVISRRFLELVAGLSDPIDISVNEVFIGPTHPNAGARRRFTSFDSPTSR